MSARTRSAASVCLALCTFFTGLTFTARLTPPATACPIVRPAQPLRVLYQRSERIAVVRVGNTELVRAEQEGYRSVRTAMHVLENLKGGGRGQTLYVNYWDYEGNETPTFVKEDRLLLFLRPSEETGGGYQIDDEQYGIKKLSDDELKVYRARINELAQILSRQPEPNDAELAEWLVRCAEEPATRWEGAYELALSAGLSGARQEADEAEDEEAEEASAATEEASAEETSEVESEEAAESEEAVESEGAGESEEAEAGESDESAAETAESAEPVQTGSGGGNSSSFVIDGASGTGTNQLVNLPMLRNFSPAVVSPEWFKLLSAAQKRRLADALFSAERIGKGEDALLTVVLADHDARLVPFLIAELRRVESAPPYEAERWVSLVARTLKDRALRKLADEYGEKAEYYDSDGVVSSEDAEGEPSSVEEETGDSAAKPLDQAAEPDAARVSPSMHKRSEMLRDFLARAEQSVAVSIP